MYLCALVVCGQCVLWASLMSPAVSVHMNSICVVQGRKVMIEQA